MAKESTIIPRQDLTRADLLWNKPLSSKARDLIPKLQQIIPRNRFYDESELAACLEMVNPVGPKNSGFRYLFLGGRETVLAAFPDARPMMKARSGCKVFWGWFIPSEPFKPPIEPLEFF